MNKSDFVSVIPKSVAATDIPKRKFKTSVDVAPLQKTDYKGFYPVAPIQRQQIKDPNLLPLTPKSVNYIDSLHAILASEKEQGDATNKDLATLMFDPIFQSVTMFIYAIGTYRGISAHTLFNYFLVEAHSESGLKSDAANPTSSARGLLQIIRGTYQHVVRAGTKLVEKNSSWVASIGKHFLSTHHKGYRLMTPFNHSNPGSDASQPFAVIGQLYGIIDAIITEWRFNGKSWEPRFNTLSAESFVKQYGGLLDGEKAGRMVLITAYHISGLSIFKKNRPFIAPYKLRFSSDRAKFIALQDDPGYLNAYVALIYAYYEGAPKSRQMGDVTISIDPDNIKSADAINTEIARVFRIPFSLSPQGSAVITSSYGLRKLRGKKRRMHEGVDIRARTVGLPVFAVNNGVITHHDDGGSGYGRNVVLKTDLGTAYRYAHLSKVFIRSGMSVVKGQILGLSGKSETTVPHLHFEYFINPNTVNPGNDVDPISDPDQGWKWSINSQ